MLETAIATEYENSAGERESSLGAGGLGRISEYFFFLETYFQATNLAECASSDPVPDESTARSFQLFRVSLCYSLQYGENELTALDALWLGLVDTVSA